MVEKKAIFFSSFQAGMIGHCADVLAHYFEHGRYFGGPGRA